MEPAGVERHRRRSSRRLSCRPTAKQSNRPHRREPSLSNETGRVLRRGRESNPRIAVLQTATFPLGYPADLRERTISLAALVSSADRGQIGIPRGERLLDCRFTASTTPIIVTV